MSSFVDWGKSTRHADIQKTRRKKRRQVTTGESLVTCYQIDDNDRDKTVRARGGGERWRVETRVEPSVSQSVLAYRAAHSSLAGSPTDTMALRHRPPLVPSSTTTCEVCTEFFFWARRVQAKVSGRAQVAYTCSTVLLLSVISVSYRRSRKHLLGGSVESVWGLALWFGQNYCKLEILTLEL